MKNMLKCGTATLTTVPLPALNVQKKRERKADENIVPYESIIKKCV